MRVEEYFRSHEKSKVITIGCILRFEIEKERERESVILVCVRSAYISGNGPFGVGVG